MLALAAALLPDARRRGLRGIAVLGACQIGLILVLAPALPALSIVLGTARPVRRRSRLSRSRAAATLSREAATPAMSVLRTIESKIEGLFEGVFGRAFRTHVQPVELARKLAKEMDEHRSVSVSRVYVPNEYTVYLSSCRPAAVRLLRGLARRRAAGVPDRARAARGVRPADPASRAVRDRRRPRRRRVRDRDAGRPAGGRGALAPGAGAAGAGTGAERLDPRRSAAAVTAAGARAPDAAPSATMIYRPREQAADDAREHSAARAANERS